MKKFMLYEHMLHMSVLERLHQNPSRQQKCLHVHEVSNYLQYIAADASTFTVTKHSALDTRSGKFAVSSVNVSISTVMKGGIHLASSSTVQNCAQTVVLKSCTQSQAEASGTSWCRCHACLQI